MNPVLLAVLLVGSIGVAAGLLLAVASKVFAVPVNEKEEGVNEILPGANCGGCGYSGCSGYAAALASGEVTDCSKCVAGGDETAQALGEYLGLAAGSVEKSCAVVFCQGTPENSAPKMEYRGDMTCASAMKLYGGAKTCAYSCVGYGDCVKACPFDAISIVNTVAVVDKNKCKACGRCVATCPKRIIDLVPVSQTGALVMCKNSDKGAAAKKACVTACIGCGKCMKVCEANAITVKNFLASVDRTKCTGCGQCAEACPDHCIILK